MLFSLFRALVLGFHVFLFPCYGFCSYCKFSFSASNYEFILASSSTFIYVSVSFTFLFIYVSASCFICVFCLNPWRARFSGVVSFWGWSPTLFEVSLVMWFPGSFPFTSYPNFVNINQCTLRVRLIASKPNLRSCLMDEGLTGVCGA